MHRVVLFIFLSTPSARRATCRPACIALFCSYFYPRPPRGGRHEVMFDFVAAGHFYPRPPRGGRLGNTAALSVTTIFLSTPSARRATRRKQGPKPTRLISIHALREEGDHRRCREKANQKYFYPRPPRGGRRTQDSLYRFTLIFLSTPSARRATLDSWHYGDNYKISIHALREEGDQYSGSRRSSLKTFLSTPSARRATSIAALANQISQDFYPRPPRGGRPR